MSAVPEMTLNSPATDAVYDPRSWRARLALKYKLSRQRTVIGQREHFGPLVVQKPFYPEGDRVCHTYLLHPPGGVVGGDRLSIHVDVEADAHALITTPASTKFYRCDDRHAEQHQQLNVASNATLEWLPQDTILFDEAKVKTSTQVELEQGSRFIGWEILCLGRPASKEKFERGYCRQTFELRQNGKPVMIERALLKGGSEILTAPWGMAGFTVTGVMLVTNANKDLLELARTVEPVKDGIGSATLIGNVLVCRALAHQGMLVRDFFSRIWQVVRQPWCGRAAVVPRIWNT